MLVYATTKRPAGRLRELKHLGWSSSRRSGRPVTGGATAGGFKGVIASLEQQKSAIERALSALRDIETT
jgi:hypothetical protein